MTDGKHEGTPPEEGDDALWRLLERAPKPKPVSPYFARRVLRDVALLAETRPAAGGVSGWLARTWQTFRRQPSLSFAGALAVVALLTVGGVTRYWHAPAMTGIVAQSTLATPAVPVPEDPAPTDAVVDNDPAPEGTVALSSEPVVTAQDVEVIADLDNLLSREESRLWTEDDTARF